MSVQNYLQNNHGMLDFICQSRKQWRTHSLSRIQWRQWDEGRWYSHKPCFMDSHLEGDRFSTSAYWVLLVFMSETAVALRTLSLFQSLSLLLQQMALITFFRIKQVLIEKKIVSGGRATLYSIDVFPFWDWGCLLNLAVCIRIAKTLG